MPRLRCHALGIVSACLVAACGSSSEATDAGSPEAGVTVHAITSATPMAKDTTLGATHSGWRRADCATCHALNHDSGYQPSTCAGCHGPNGAPARPRATHPTLGGCDGCHAGRHQGAGFTSPRDCTTCHAYPTGDACGFTESYDVVVVGAGGGGLSAAAALAKAGKKVILLEKSYKVGGCMTAFDRGPYRFEASLHGFDGLVDGQGMNVDLFKALGLWDRVEILRPDPMYRAVYPDFSVDVPADVAAYRALLKERFPAQADGIDGLFDEVADLGRILKEFIRAQVAGTTPNVTTEELTRLQAAMTETLGTLLDRHLQDERLYAVWTQLAGFAGAEPQKVSALFFVAMWYSYHHGGYHYFTGGSQAVSDGLAAIVTEHGGVVRPNSLVTRIVVENNQATQVQTADGACYDTSYVVSNANAPDTVLKLVGAEKFPADYVERVNAMTVGLSAVVVYLGVDHDYRDVFGTTHEIMVSDSYDVHAGFQAVTDCRPEATPIAVANYTVLDPTNAPAGKNVIAITSQLGYECNSQWQWNSSHAAYKAYKEQVAQGYIQRAEALLPGLAQHIEVMEVATPLTIKGYTLNPAGTIFGWDNTLEQAAQNRLAQQTPVPNLYLAGAWTFPGGGQSAVLVSGALAANAIIAASSH